MSNPSQPSVVVAPEPLTILDRAKVRPELSQLVKEHTVVVEAHRKATGTIELFHKNSFF